MAKVELQPAYVIHTRPWRETSLLVELFTPEYGRKGVIARGARSAKSAYRALLQAHRPLMASWTGRGELGTLIGAEPAGPALALRGDSLFSAFYINELIERLCHHHDAQLELFALYERSLAQLAGVTEPLAIEVVLRRFELQLLQLLGYGLRLDVSVDDHRPIDAQHSYYYHPDQGALSVRHDDAVRITGHSLLALAANQLCTDEALGRETLKDAKRLMRVVLSRHLGARPLKSREMFARRGGRSGGGRGGSPG